jgi:hypothetical protein
MRTLGAFLWRYVIGSLFTLTPFTAVLVVGWTQRATARAVARRWHKQTGSAENFATFAQAEDDTASLAHWPRWIMADNASALFAEARQSRPLRAVALALRATFGSLWANAVSGVRALVPIAIVIAPASALWLFSWWAGWDNSFNKGYEQSNVGLLIAVAGVIYFIVAMTLLPLAEVRHAVNNSWPAFFDISFLRRTAHEAKLGLIGLAALFVTAGFVVAALKVAPLAIGNSSYSPADLEAIARNYPLLVAGILFPLYAGLRLAAARIYARATLRLAAKDFSKFTPRERSLLKRLGVDLTASMEQTTLKRLAAGTGTIVAGILTSTVMFAAWFGLVAEIYVSQFLVHDWTHWINHPLIQLPWSESIFRPN